MTRKMTKNIPLAEKLRPQDIDAFVGQRHLLGPDKLLDKLRRESHLPSLLLWGPPGVGKTTLARILASQSGANFVFFSAVLSGIKEVRAIVSQAENTQRLSDQATVLFVDEIHRFNKSQQDGFLPHVESGLLTLIGATTENPSFHVIAPLLSRCRTLVLNALDVEELSTIINNGITFYEEESGETIKIDPDALAHMANTADGDGRTALNSIELAIRVADIDDKGCRHIILAEVEEAIQRKSLRYDNGGEEHYNITSALHKSLRDSDPDGALYWLARMLKAGEEPLYIARRLIRFASEDIGNADPHALAMTISARDSYQTLGSPEGELALAQAVIYLATAPKSNAVYTAYKAVMQEVANSGSLPVPMHIRNAPSGLMKKLGYGKGYKYAHDAKDGIVFQEHLPEKLSGKRFYEPTNRGHEAIIKDRLTKWRQILKRQQAN